MLDFATSGPEYARAINEARQLESDRRRWNRELDEMSAEGAGRRPRMSLLRPSAGERRRRALEAALDAAQAEGITVDEWFRMQRVDPALFERANWAGLTDELTAMTRRGRAA
jgi:hypothetical protein